jgi:hypothetical protein
MGTKRQMAERVEAVAQLRLEGKEYPQIAQFCAAQGWPHGVSQTYLYIRRADLLLARYVERNRDVLLAKRLTRRNVLWSKALQAGDLRLALAVEKDETALLNFYPGRPAPGTNVQVNNVIPALTEQQRIALDSAMLRRAGRLGDRAEAGGQGVGDGPVLSGARGDHGGCGQAPRPVAAGPVADAAAGDVITVQPAEQPVPPVRRTEQPVPAGPPGPGEERSVCLECGRRYLRQQPGVVFRCPACNAP